MTSTLRESLKRLSEAVAVSGVEDEVRKVILEAIQERVSDVRIDPMGNVTAVCKGTARSPLRVMLSAHMDEPGFMVTEVGEDGLIHIAEVGAHDKRFLPARPVWVGKNKTPGVLLWAPIHKSAGKNDLVDGGDMSIDVGADAKGGVKAGPGDRIGFASTYTELSPNVVRGKAFDSRAACAALLDLIGGDPFPFDLHLAFTAQSSIGGRGASVAAHRLAPQVAFVLTGVTCNDIPLPEQAEDRAPTVRLGAGPVILSVDPGLIARRKLLDVVLGVASEKGIPRQIEAPALERNDGGAIGLSRAGVATLVIAVPVRYLGSPNALLDLTDLENTVRLLRETLNALTPAVLE